MNHTHCQRGFHWRAGEAIGIAPSSSSHMPAASRVFQGRRLSTPSASPPRYHPFYCPREEFLSEDLSEDDDEVPEPSEDLSEDDDEVPEPLPRNAPADDDNEVPLHILKKGLKQRIEKQCKRWREEMPPEEVQKRLKHHQTTFHPDRAPEDMKEIYNAFYEEFDRAEKDRHHAPAWHSSEGYTAWKRKMLGRQ